MKNYEIKWLLKSPLSTELESDTIFGHFCWSYRYLKGEEKLVEFLDKLKIKDISFIASNGFQDRILPMPKLPLDANARARIEDELKFSYEEKRKEIKAMNTIKLSDLKDYVNDFSLEKLISAHYKGKLNLLPDNNKMASIITHNTINRLTGTTSVDMENLFKEIVNFYPDNTTFYSWVKTEYFNLKEMQEVFTIMSQYGYGKNKNIGKGNFDIEVNEIEELIETTDNINAWVLLSNCVPDENDTINVMYNSKVKFGKLGGNAALKNSPFKHPIFMLTPGTVFFSKQQPHGTILEKVHPFDDKVIQNLCAYTIPITISQDLIEKINTREDKHEC
ncbi:MAG TPA: hypothetical protein PKZ69_04485 [Candidatus Cloacimonadota bacterium]|nr:hypothetical protein [Candidatus Cloacimonadota bacterium]HOQ80276.1 hypothetical protein [Candidatus Cloacimonadota bacterium]HPK40859.1 hypothetical protein [Candidatus Cloacimonadota bacterium]